MNKRLLQIRSDSLSAEYIYTDKINKIEVISVTSNTLTIIVPILFSGALLIAKGTKHEEMLNIISIALSAILLSIVIFSLIFRIEQKKENYLIGRRSNTYIANEALRLIELENLDLTWFFNYVNEMDSKDKENIGKISENLKKEAYRNTLERIQPGQSDVICPICKKSPFSYKKGSCQVCGNTP